MPSAEDLFVVGSMGRPRGVEIYSADQGKQVARLSNPEMQASVTSLHAVHPSRPLIVGGNSSGRVYAWVG